MPRPALRKALVVDGALDHHLMVARGRVLVVQDNVVVEDTLGRGSYLWEMMCVCVCMEVRARMCADACVCVCAV